jgi:hypothetical protein
MNIKELVGKYFGQIEIECTNFVPVNDAVSDAAYLVLSLPAEMLREYQRLKGREEQMPDGTEFWKEIELVRTLRKCEKYPARMHAPLSDILDYLGGEVWVAYQQSNNPDRIKLSITEVLEYSS